MIDEECVVAAITGEGARELNALAAHCLRSGRRPLSYVAINYEVPRSLTSTNRAAVVELPLRSPTTTTATSCMCGSRR